MLSCGLAFGLAHGCTALVNRVISTVKPVSGRFGLPSGRRPFCCRQNSNATKFVRARFITEARDVRNVRVYAFLDGVVKTV